MSIRTIDKEPKSLEARRTVVINQALGTVYSIIGGIIVPITPGIGSAPFQVNLQQNQIDFIPTRMAIRQICYTQLGGLPGVPGPPVALTQGTDLGILNIYCSLSRQPIAITLATGLGFTLAPEQIINIPTYNPIIEFAVLPTAAFYSQAAGGLIPSTTPTGFLSMTLEFF